MNNQLTGTDLRKSVYLTQGIIFFIAVVISFWLFDSWDEFNTLFDFNFNLILYYGVLPALIIISIDMLLDKYLSEKHLDDGGINKLLFQNQSILSIFLIALTVSISEEFLFRGVLQTSLGYIEASTIFAVIHIRYLKKPVLMISIVCVSFYIGYLFEITGNLYVTMTSHFLIDFILGLLIKYKSRGEISG